MSALIPTKNPQFLEPGMRFTSIPFTTDALAPIASGGVPLPIYKGFGFGFCITPDRSGYPFSSVLKINLLGQGKGSNDYIYANPDIYYEGAFQGLAVEGNDRLNYPYEYDTGYFICNIALKSDARVFPSSLPLTASNIPTASGGNPVSYNSSWELDLAGVAPSGTDGVALGNRGYAESMYKVWVQAPSGQIITGGGVDLWRKNGSVWCIIASNITLIPGYRNTQIPVDYFGPRNAALTVNSTNDRFYATPSIVNPITLDGAGTTVTMFVQLQ